MIVANLNTLDFRIVIDIVELNKCNDYCREVVSCVCVLLVFGFGAMICVVILKTGCIWYRFRLVAWLWNFICVFQVGFVLDFVMRC